MSRSSLVKSACMAIALSGLCPPDAGAIEMQGSNPTAQFGDGLISKAYIAHRGVTAVGPRGGVYHRGGTYRGYGYHGGGVRRLLGRLPLAFAGASLRSDDIKDGRALARPSFLALAAAGAEPLVGDAWRP
jgi:hypothetical protein